MYKQTLYKVIEPIKINTIKRLNKSKKWEYGYNKEHDIIVISKTGQIGEIYEIQNLRIALPKSQSVCKKHNKWIAKDYPKELQKLKTIFDNYKGFIKNTKYVGIASQNVFNFTFFPNKCLSFLLICIGILCRIK